MDDLQALRSFWRAVLVQAFRDALGERICDGNVHDKARARLWFERAGEDFREVCSYAEFCPIEVQRKYMILKDRNLSLRAIDVIKDIKQLVKEK